MRRVMLQAKIIRLASFAITSLLFLGSLYGQSITRTVLDNGLTVIVKEDHALPVVSVKVHVHVGSRYETEKTAGVSHFLEHLVFRHSDDGKPASARRRVRELGALASGETGYDTTHYDILIRSAHFNEALDIIVEILMKATFSSDDVESEKKIVTEEYRRKRQDIPRLSFAEFVSAVFSGQPYGQEPIGTLEVINRVQVKELYDWYKTFYVPNNMTLVVVGDVKREDAIRKITERFGIYKPKLDLPPKPRILNAFSDYLLTSKKAHFKGRASCNLGFILPGLKHPDRYALELVYNILVGGTTGRLNWRLVEQEKVASKISPTYQNFEDQGLMLFTILPRETKDTYRIPEAALHEILKLKQTGITAEELTKAKELVERKFIFDSEDLGDQAEALAKGESLGGVKYAASYLENINKVSLDDVKRVLSLYLCKENLKILHLVPEEMEGISSEQSKKIAALADAMSVGALKPTGLDFSRVLYKESEAHEVQSGEIAHVKQTENRTTTERLKNGLTLVVAERHGLPITSVSLQIKAGPRYGEKAGLAKAVSLMLMEGARRLSKEQILKRNDELGGKLQTELNREVIMINSTYLAKDVQAGLELIAEMVTEPLLDAAGFKNVTSLLSSESKRKSDELSSVAKNLLLETIFQNQSYGFPMEGTLESINSMDIKDVVKFYRQYYTPKNAVLIIVGDIDHARAKQLAVRYFESWKSPVGQSKAFHVQAHGGGTITKPVAGKEQVQLGIGVPFRSPLNNEYAKKHFIGFAVSRRSFFELVYNQSISYTTGSYVEPLYAAPILYAYVSVDKKNIDRARKVVIRNINELVRGEITDSELDKLKRDFIGVYSLLNVKSLFTALTLGYYETMGKSNYYPDTLFKEIERIDAKSLAAYARKDIDLGKLTTVVVGPVEQE